MNSHTWSTADIEQASNPKDSQPSEFLKQKPVLIAWLSIIWSTIIIVNVLQMQSTTTNTKFYYSLRITVSLLCQVAIWGYCIFRLTRKNGLQPSTESAILEISKHVTFVIISIDEISIAIGDVLSLAWIQTSFAMSFIIIEPSLIWRLYMFSFLVIRNVITWHQSVNSGETELNISIIALFYVGIIAATSFLVVCYFKRKASSNYDLKTLQETITCYLTILRSIPYKMAVFDTSVSGPVSTISISSRQLITPYFATSYLLESNCDPSSLQNMRLKNFKQSQSLSFCFTQKLPINSFIYSYRQEPTVTKERILSHPDEYPLVEDLRSKYQLQDVFEVLSNHIDRSMKKRDDAGCKIELPCIEASIEGTSDQDLDQNLLIQPLLINGTNKLMFIVCIQENTSSEDIHSLKLQNQNLLKLMSTTVHDLRTPLNGSIILTENTLEEGNISLQQIENLKGSINCQKRLLSLINDLLDYSQLNFKKFNVSFNTFELRTLISEITKIVEVQAKLKKIQLIPKVYRNCPKFIKSDMNRISQILLNLLGNALKFTIKGSIKLVVKKHPSIKNYIVFKVKDTGIGIKKDQQDVIFKMFEKAVDGHSSLNPSGAGLGLYISNALAERLGTPIQVKSTEGEGSVFKFAIEDHSEDNDLIILKSNSALGGIQKFRSNRETRSNNRECLSPRVSQRLIPIDNFHGHERLSLSKFSSNNPNYVSFSIMNEKIIPSFTPKNKFNVNQQQDPFEELGEDLRQAFAQKKNEISTILVVDDDHFNHIAVEKLLQKIGFYQILKGFNGLEAIEKLQEDGESINLVLMDCKMPIKDGYSAVKEIKELMATGHIRKIPIIACTALVDESEAFRCSLAGFDSVIAKPIKLETLRSLLNDFSL